MMGLLSKFRSKVTCPSCLAELSGQIEKCHKCDYVIPLLYLNQHKELPPLFVQMFGWSRVGKTVFLYALTLMLRRMTEVWERYSHQAANQETVDKVKEIERTIHQEGTLPPGTLDHAVESIYIMLLRDMELWNNRMLVMRDLPGERFDDFTVDEEFIPYLLHAPTTFMFLSLSDLETDNSGRSIEMLLSGYLNTLLHYDTSSRNMAERSLVVVLTKADQLGGRLPSCLANYLKADPIWAGINSPSQDFTMCALETEEYIEEMERASFAIGDWITQSAAGKNFVRIAANHNLTVKYSLISSTGSEPEMVRGSLRVRLEPKRVLDPFFWALELQSK